MNSAMGHSPESFALADLTAALPDHTLEYILARVPFVWVGATRCVCKRWQTLTTSPTFLTLCSERQERAESWLYVNGFRYNVVTDHTSPPATSSMLELPAGYSWGAGNLAYTVADTSSQLQYKLSLLDPQVRVAPLIPAIVPAIVAVVRNLRDDGAHMLIVAGSEASEESLSTIAVFDSKSQSWSFCEDLPAEFRRIPTSRSVSAVVCNRRLYLLHIYSGLVTSLDLAPDLATRRWSECLTLRPPGTQYCYLAVRRGSLVLVGVSHEQACFCFRGWNVAAAPMECTGDSWPVVCHFGSYKPSGSFRPRRKKKPSNEVPVASSSSCRDFVVAFANCFRKFTFCAGITGFFGALDFSKAAPS